MDVAVVTGAASGIGAALARQLAERGVRLVLADRDAGPLGRLAGQLSAQAVVVDVADPADNERLAAVAGVPDLVCLNAGVSSAQAAPVWETRPEEWRRVLDVNLGGVVNGLRAFVPRLLAVGGPRRILITASLAGPATWPGGGAYAASKHGRRRGCRAGGVVAGWHGAVGECAVSRVGAYRHVRGRRGPCRCRGGYAGREREGAVEGRGFTSVFVPPTRLHTNPQAVIEGRELAVAAAHAKVRRGGYRAVQRG